MLYARPVLMTLPSAQALGLVFPIKKEQDGAGLESMRHFPCEIARSESQQLPGWGQDVGLPGPGLPRLFLLQESRVGCSFGHSAWPLGVREGQTSSGSSVPGQKC